MSDTVEMQNSSSIFAGKPAPREMLVDVARLERDYFECLPDLRDPNQFVSFGTSGHRGSPLQGTFTEAHIMAKMTRAPGNNAPIDGLKVVAKSGWFAARPSRTENIYKIYAESFKSAQHLNSIVAEAQEMVSNALRSSAGGRQ